MKSERLKKLEVELNDLNQWLKLGLVPKKDIAKHKEEIQLLQEKIEEEKERLKFIRENGETEEYIAPKRALGKQVYAEPQTLPEINVRAEPEEPETETFETETISDEVKLEETTIVEDFDEEDPFSDRNRWRRGIPESPDENW